MASAFSGLLAEQMAESTPAWPEPLRAKAGLPNVVFMEMLTNIIR
jgi:arylsulfatase